MCFLWGPWKLADHIFLNCSCPLLHALMHKHIWSASFTVIDRWKSVCNQNLLFLPSWAPEHKSGIVRIRDDRTNVFLQHHTFFTVVCLQLWTSPSSCPCCLFLARLRASFLSVSLLTASYTVSATSCCQRSEITRGKFLYSSWSLSSSWNPEAEKTIH